MRAQNAALLITKVDNGINVEAFELSPRNEQVITTLGRLQRIFPGPALEMDPDAFKNPEFLVTIAQALERMSHQEVANTRTQVTKAGQKLDEDRDTTHPKIVTELLMGFLRPMCKATHVSRIRKSTHEEVMWNSSRSPWRRSPLWLLIRVSLQLVMSRQTRQIPRFFGLYKYFMVFFMSHFLDWASESGLSSEHLQAMSSKIGRRLLKLNLPSTAPWIPFVRHALEKTGHIIDGRWQKAIAHSGYKHDMSLLECLHFAEDIYYTLDDLDKFIMDMKAREANIQGSTNFEPPTIRIGFNATEFPKLSRTYNSKYETYNLAALEQWIAENLDNWLQKHIADGNTCGQLGGLMQGYHQVAMDTYRGDPEAISVMMLSLLELWIACDKSATHIYGMLHDYDPCVPIETFQVLVLRFHSQLARLARAEEYMRRRQQGVRFPGPGIFQEFGTRNCFSVRYFDGSVDHKALLDEIETHAYLERESKKAELREKKTSYAQLMKKYELAECEYYEVSAGPEDIFEKKRHAVSCQRCSYKKQAYDISIAIHEWPLSRNRDEMKSTIFELHLPRPFGNWRDTAMFFIMDALGVEYSEQMWPRSTHPLSTYSGLHGYFTPCKNVQRICLLSQDKPHGITHRNSKNIIEVTEHDVCLDNGLHFRYFDSKIDCFLAAFKMTYRSATLCVYQMPTESTSLQGFLFRPSGAPDGPPPNQAIASQRHTCPEHLTSAEYNALCTIPLGVEVQWQNILVQLSMPQIDWKRLETCILILQTIYQAGPPGEQEVPRKGHKILREESFARTLLNKIANSIDRIKDNWESAQALCTFACITSRVLSLTLSDSIRETCLEILQYLREIVFEWVELVKGKASRAIYGEERDHLVALTVRLALICVCSFDTEDEYLRTTLARNSEASLFILCCVTIQEWGNSLYPLEASDPLLPVLHRRWETLCYRTHLILTRRILEENSRVLDVAIQRAWSGFRGGDSWSAVTEQPSCWLYSRTMNHGNADRKLLIHFNLLTGEILVNGLPLSRLPSEYETHQSYQRLFGHSALEIMPSPVPGMDFSAKRDHMEHTVHLGLLRTTDNFTTDLVVCAVKGEQVLQYLPPRLLEGLFPDAFVHNFVHWYDDYRKLIEFRPAGQAWKSSSSNWRLRRDHRKGWCLAKDEDYLVSIKSATAETIGCILAPVAEPSKIHCILHLESSHLEIDIPVLQLGFTLGKGSSSIRSKQSRGMEVDGDQSLDSLVGLHNRLLLKCPKRLGRAVIVPDGEVDFQREGDHVKVKIDLETATNFQVYTVDYRLGQLVDNGSLQSKLILCYLHALTSFCIPDPLTGRTGTEQALTILRSAAVRSFETLHPEHTSILASIAALTPERRYYPAGERVMQSVTWQKSLSFLTQHGEFYTRVVDIFDQDRRQMMLSSAKHERHPDLPHVETELLQRDSIRSSLFRVSEFGAESHTCDQDHSYRSLDCNQESQEGSRAFLMSKAIYSGIPITRARPADNLLSHLWQFLSSVDCIFGSNKELGDMKGKFDAQVILEPMELISQHWCAIHNQLLRSGHKNRLNKFQAMMWFSTMAFAKDVDMTVLEALVSVYTISEMDQVNPPSGALFYLSRGYQFNNSALLHKLGCSLLRIEKSPDWTIASYPGEARTVYKCRRSRTFQRNREKALEQFISAIQSQWPVRSPSKPAFDGSLNIWSYINIKSAMAIVRELFSIWFDNMEFRDYIRRLSHVFSEQAAHSITIQPYIFQTYDNPMRHKPGFVGVGDILCGKPPNVDLEPPQLQNLLRAAPLGSSSELRSRILSRKLELLSRSNYEKNYIDQLRGSIESLQQTSRDWSIVFTDPHLRDVLASHLYLCQDHLRSVYNAITARMSLQSVENMPCEMQHPTRHAVMATLACVRQWPRVSPILLLQQMAHHRWVRLTDDWKRCFVAYGLALAANQRAERLVSLIGAREDLIREIRNKGHTDWDPLEFPETLLVEIENSILIREVQEQIAKQMRTSRPGNVVMQLNMGEGKSSVIIPITSAALANGSCLVVVIVPKPQSRQMFQMLVSKLGGLLDRRVYHLPVCRTLKIGEAEANEIRKICHDCMSSGGVLLVQPEHILSLKLMGLENLISGSGTVGSSVLKTLDFFRTDSRVIVDESDENFGVKFELIYTMGSQRPMEFSPRRWILIHQLLHIVREIAPDLHKEFPHSMELEDLHPGSFPRMRFLHHDAQHSLMVRLLEHICDHGIEGLPISRQPKAVRNAVFNYALNAELEPTQIAAVEDQGTTGFWTDATKSPLLLLRGLIAGGVLSFCLGQKRWRVNYGLDSERQPPTRLAVPYRAKDKPSTRSEYSHPDVVLILTFLSYYYGGLGDDDIFLSFSHLLKSDQADAEYAAWVVDAPGLPDSYRHLVGINLEDRYHCSKEVFPRLRFSKSMIDYFLAHLVFPKVMREFPEKLTASGWDIGETKTHPTIGFSGTNDSRTTLPLDVEQLDLPEQNHTNALVIENLLRPENSVAFYHSQHRESGSDANALLHMVTSLDPPAQVILDVGAQIIELSNVEVAEAWLKLITNHKQTQAIVFFDENDELVVLDRKGRVEALQISPFSKQLELCHIFLDEAHTRGTDLKLPEYYRAAVTLGAGLTKDKLVQGKRDLQP